MFERLKLLKRLSYKPSEGEIKLNDSRMFMGPTSLLVHTRDKLMDIGPTGNRFLYDAGKEAGKDFAVNLVEVCGDSENEMEIVEMAAHFSSMTGWGDIEVIDADQRKDHYRIKIENGFFDTDGTEPTPYTSGMLAGASEKIQRRDIDVVKDKEESDEEVEYYIMKPSEDLQVSWSS